MLAKECMTQSVQLGNPQMTLRNAAQLMKEGDFGILPISSNDRLVGVLTDRDIVIRSTAHGLDPNEVLLKDVMTKGVLYCYEDQSLEEIAENLGDNQVRRLPVLNREKRLVGILSIGDLAQSGLHPQKLDDCLIRISSDSHHAYEMPRPHA